MNAPPLIHTTRSRSRYLVDITLTILGWLMFLLLFTSGLFSLLRNGMNAAHEVSISPIFVSTSSTLILYATFAVLNAAVLIGWAVYNYRRFSGKNRRTSSRPLPRQHLEASFALAPDQLEHAQAARIMVISHENDGTICAIKIIAQAGSISPQAHATTPSPIPGKTASPLPDKQPTGQTHREDTLSWQWQKPLPTASTP